MPTVCVLPGGIRIEQYYADHHPPHFHALQGSDEVLLRIADLSIYQGTLARTVLHDVIIWAKDHQPALALNWVYALAKMPLDRIPWP